MDKKKDYEIEIDIKQIFYVISDKIAIILLTGIIVALAAFLYTKFYVTPEYKSTASVYVINRVDSDSATTYQDTLSASNLANDFEEMIKTRKVMEEVIAELQIDTSVGSLSSRVSVSSPSGSRIIYITVLDEDPYEAKKIVDEIVTVAQKRSADMMQIESVKKWDEGSINTSPVSPNVKKNVLMAFLGSIVFAIVVVLMRYALDDTLKKPEDIEKKLGLSVLGAIPYEDKEKNGRKKKSHRK